MPVQAEAGAMSAVLLPPRAPGLARRAPPAPPMENASTGVSPTLAAPLCPATPPPAVMHVAGPATAAPSRFSVWRELESRSDRLASYGALAVGLGVFAAFLLL